MAAAKPNPPPNRVQNRVQVCVGILVRDDGALLLTSRPAGKAYAGYWEFPGGKIEAGESIEEALRRELYEELGIVIDAAHLWQTTQHDYEHAHVDLHWCKVFAWQGELQMREAQQAAWQTFPLQVAPVLPGSVAVLEQLRAQAEYGLIGQMVQV